jgi:hypothetical protein
VEDSIRAHVETTGAEPITTAQALRQDLSREADRRRASGPHPTALVPFNR